MAPAAAGESGAPPPRLVLYVGPACGRCDAAARGLGALAAELGERWTTVDIASDPELERRYLLEIPVVAVDGQAVSCGRVDRGAVRRALAAATPLPGA